MLRDLPDIADPAEPLRALAACPAHAATPLVAKPDLAARYGWAALHLKAESERMGLGSFKALGGAWAVATLACERIAEATGRAPDFADLRDERFAAALDGMTVCCASAGNHGLSVAAGARVFGIACEVHLAETVPEAFAERLRVKGARVVRSGAVYEEALAAAEVRAREGAILVSDAATERDMRTPSRVMQGYAVMAEEIAQAFRESGEWPDVVALQAGVGGLAASVAAHIRREWPVRPRIVIVEPDRAACLGASVAAGRPARHEGPVSNMGRLDCKEPSLRGFEVLREAADDFVTVSDEEADAAARELASVGLATTPSGAAGFAGLVAHGVAGMRALALVTEEPTD